MVERITILGLGEPRSTGQTFAPGKICHDIFAAIKVIELDEAIRAGLDTAEALYEVIIHNFLIDGVVPEIRKNYTIYWLTSPVPGELGRPMSVVRSEIPPVNAIYRKIVARIKQ